MSETSQYITLSEIRSDIIQDLPLTLIRGRRQVNMERIHSSFYRSNLMEGVRTDEVDEELYGDAIRLVIARRVYHELNISELVPCNIELDYSNCPKWYNDKYILKLLERMLERDGISTEIIGGKLKIGIEKPKGIGKLKTMILGKNQDDIQERELLIDMEDALLFFTQAHLTEVVNLLDNRVWFRKMLKSDINHILEGIKDYKDPFVDKEDISYFITLGENLCECILLHKSKNYDSKEYKDFDSTRILDLVSYTKYGELTTRIRNTIDSITHGDLSLSLKRGREMCSLMTRIAIEILDEINEIEEHKVFKKGELVG